jgi:hypothetical protein
MASAVLVSHNMGPIVIGRTFGVGFQIDVREQT